MKTTTDTPPQGIMTNEVGAITGEVEITTEDQSNGVAVSVAYAGARDVYTVEGSPAPAGSSHEEIVQSLTRDEEQATRIS